MLGVEGELAFTQLEGAVEVSLPTLLPGKLPAEHVWTLKVTKTK